MIPETKDALVLRTDFSDEAAWQAVCAAIQKPQEIIPGQPFQAYVEFVSDSQYDGLAGEELLTSLVEGPYRSFAFVVDSEAITNPVHPILVIDLNEYEEPGRTFRVIPSQMWSVENSLSIANADFRDFADVVDENGIHRGFPTE